jgi:ABC-type glycerol-3-phosphate transport system substrate-binding protein
VNTSGAAEVAQFVKDLRWRFDVMPPPQKCTYSNLMRMFAEGKLATMMLPADGETIDRLLKLGMNLDDIGIAELPKGPKNRDHLTYGRCLIVNSQLDRDRRAAAFKWILFMADPEVLKLREQFFYREQEYTGEPRVPLYVPERQTRLYEEIKPFRSLPLYMDYEQNIANLLTLGPSFNQNRLYEAIALGVFPIVEKQDSDPVQEVSLVATDFEQKYLRQDTSKENMIKKAVKEMLPY